MEALGYFIFMSFAMFMAITFGVVIGFGLVPLVAMLFKRDGQRVKLPIWPKIIIAFVSMVIAMYYMAVFLVKSA